MSKKDSTVVNFSQYSSILREEVVTIHTLLSYFKKTDMDYDRNGNILINFNKDTAGSPILVAHLDNVLSGEREPVMDLSASTIFGKKNGIGFDDKAGIIGIIEIWRRSKDKQFRIIFTSDEEVGGVGALALDKRYYEDAAYIIELDRRGNNDLINVSGTTRLCSEEFADMFAAYGFKRATGTFTDVNIFKENAPKVNMVNLSIGYYNAHTDNEYLNVRDFQYIVDCVADFIETNRDCIPDETPIDNRVNPLSKEPYATMFQDRFSGFDDQPQCDWCGKNVREEDAIYDGDQIFCCKHCWETAYFYDEEMKELN